VLRGVEVTPRQHVLAPSAVRHKIEDASGLDAAIP
jgi:hypothetical protein